MESVKTRARTRSTQITLGTSTWSGGEADIDHTVHILLRRQCWLLRLTENRNANQHVCFALFALSEGKMEKSRCWRTLDQTDLVMASNGDAGLLGQRSKRGV